MSLLLEALKKAELAKQGRKPADEEAPGALQLEPVPPKPAGAAQSVITRQELPDISQPLEILSEDLPSASAKRAVDEATVDRIAARAAEQTPVALSAVASAPPPPGRPARAAEPEVESPPNTPAGSPEPGGAAERDAARQLFEAKEVEYNPKRNFHITIGVLLAAGAGYGGYVWWELQPKSVSTPAAAQSAPKGAPAATAALPPQAAPAPAEAPPAAALPTPPVAAKAGAPAEPQPAARAMGPVFARSEAGAAPGARAPDRPTEAGPAPGERSPITITPPALAVDPLVARAYESYQRGDLAGAREAYQQMLQREPLNRDALLGLAAIDVRERAFDTAETRYIKLLELDPRDVHAQAGLMALRGQVEPVQSESRLKTLIAGNPDASGLYFPLGNQYAQQSRWTEAQAAYFKAYAGDAENADFAFNLAVSLDQLRQTALALQYYRRALALAENRPHSFDPAQIHTRIQELERR
jgi:tetratricopeptide (TPR) repeat protein